MIKSISFKTKGMQRDLSASAFNSEYSYENKNVRIIPTNENTLLSLVNEKGNKKSDILGVGDHIKGIPIGQALINDELILFTAGYDDHDTNIIPDISEASDISLPSDISEASDIDPTTEDRIYKLWFDNGALVGKRLFRGNLGFNYKHPIEAISFYENADIKKVYWTDGLNQPRVINIAAASDIMDKWDADSFNFVRKLSLNEKVTIKKNTVASGDFAPGVIQYAFTYFNKYGQESNIFYTSPLYYISYNNRGASPEDKVSNSFNIEVVNVDKRFDYVRIYSIHRTSINAIPNVKRVVDLAPPDSSQYVIDATRGYQIYLPIEKIQIGYANSDKRVRLNDIPPNTETSSSKIWRIHTGYLNKVFFDNGNYIQVFPPDETMVIEYFTSYGAATLLCKGESILHDHINVKVSYTDNGLSGDSMDPTELLYIGGEEVIFGTMTQKDNTLFLGDVKLQRKILDSSIRNYFKGKDITFSIYDKSISSPEPRGYYPYSNQLRMNSYQIKTFKYLEYYRFGIQAQHYTGKWSEPIWINDVKNTVHIDTTFYEGGNIGLPVAEFTLNDASIIKSLLGQGYIRVRPVVVYPTINDRESVCQGILCPTVYNTSDRFSNSSFVQSSWFARPNAPFDEQRAFHDSTGERSGDWAALINYGIGVPSMYSRAGIMSNDRTKVKYNEDGKEKEKDIDIVNKGAWVEFRHNYPIPGNSNRNAEIQCITEPPNPYIKDDFTPSQVSNWVSNNAENYYIDQSILTFHSPDIEFDDEVRSIDTSGLKLRIVGIVPLTSFASDIDIQTSTPVNNFKDSSDHPIGFYKEPIGVENDFTYSILPGNSHFGWRGLVSGAFWFDEINAYKKDTGNTEKLTTGFVVYPWHRNGSLNNAKFATDGYRPAMLDKKKISNMRFSYKTKYMDPDSIWNAYINGEKERTGISGVAVFDSNEISLVKLPAPKYSNLADLNYYGNVDKLLTISRIGNKKNSYPIITTGVQNIGKEEEEEAAHFLFSGSYIGIGDTYTDQITGTDPVRIKYKSTPHAVLALNYTTKGDQRILPTIEDGGYREYWTVNHILPNTENVHLYWGDKDSGKAISQDVIRLSDLRGPVSGVRSIQHGWLWLGELYNDNIQNRFGGQTEEAFENNMWLPCGDPISLVDATNGIKSSITIKWEEGDTYYQRYDHIKTYPFTLEDQNSVTDIVSFMCETRVNLDGRYDRNRGQTSNLAITPENFNLMNNVYSQPNNFFNYRAVNPNKLNLDNFHNSITWTKTKTAGELTDSWTNITLASTLDLDGDKGTVRALRRLNNNIFAFQDKGISHILYNENMQITSTEGVPIEIANSGKVNGKRYVSNKIGCTNKWSICETPNGIYFIDDITKGIFLFNGQLNNISDKLGFHSWISKASNGINIWNPVDFDGFVTYYDKISGDVFFISKSECLAFSEPLGQFSSFYSYEKTPYFTNLEDRGIAFNVEGTGTLYKPWLHNEGDYNMFFGAYQPFYTTIIANPDMPVDKIFNNLEFRSDSWDKDGNLLNTTFDTLTTWNEYQQGVSTLNNVLRRPSNLKRRFRIWRANIPRAKANGRDRMRNPWLYIKLSMEKENVNKTVLHDMIVHYFNVIMGGGR